MEQTSSIEQPRYSIAPHTTAWIVVISSFVIFCIMCAAVTFAAYWFLFESPTTVIARLTVSRGAITIINPDGTSLLLNDPNNSTRTIASNVALRTDSNSQGYITFEDTSTKRIISTVFLLANSNITLTESTRPRFDWSRRSYNITFTAAMGRFVLDIPPRLTRTLILDMQSPSGTARLGESGTYMIDAIDQYIKLYTQSGRGFLVNLSGHAWQIDETNQGILARDKQETVIQAFRFDMLNSQTNPTFAKDSLGSYDDIEASPTIPPPGWACNYDPQQNSAEPPGYWRRQIIDQFPTLHMWRGEAKDKGKLGHAEMGCEYWFSNDPKGQDITGYKSLSIRLKMKLIDQDLTTCGIQGSECPIMLMLEYLPADMDELNPLGDVQVWRQGFYALRPPDDTNIPRCDTCPHDHEQVNLNTWYIYDTGDMLKQLPANKRPISIRRVRIYASGHQFDATLAEVAVLGGQ